MAVDVMVLVIAPLSLQSDGNLRSHSPEEYIA